MLEDLTIKDFALIDAASIEFSNGFTVLSGETGAGKSILIGALSFLLGGKADAQMIRTGTHEATVAGTFLLGQRVSLPGTGVFHPVMTLMKRLSLHRNGLSFTELNRRTEGCSSAVRCATAVNQQHG